MTVGFSDGGLLFILYLSVRSQQTVFLRCVVCDIFLVNVSFLLGLVLFFKLIIRGILNFFFC